MVQIAEYTRRENANISSLGDTNLRLPSALSEPSAANQMGKKILETSSELGKVYAEMKERRDEGITSGFMNQYDIDSTKKITELKNKYRGQDAQKIMPEFQQWRDAYISKYSSYNEDTSDPDHIYLENETQLRLARTKLDAYNVRDINSLSGYIAQEEEQFRVNNLKTFVSNNVEKISVEEFPQNAEISKQNIYSGVAQLYKGQSKEFIDKAAGEILNDAIYSNVMRDSAINPISSIGRFQNEPFTKEMNSQTREKAREELKKAFVSYQAIQLANAQTGRQASPAGEAFYRINKSFFKGTENQVKEEINNKAIEIRNGILEKDERNTTAVVNDLTVQFINARTMAEMGITEEDKKKYLAIEAGTLSGLMGVKGGIETAQMLNNVYTEVGDYDWLMRVENKYKSGSQPLMESGKNVPTRQEVLDRLAVYEKKRISGYEKLNGVIHNINNGRYETLLDISDFDSFSPHQKKEIIKSFADNARYKSLIATAKDKSNIDFDSKIDSIFKFERGEPYKHPAMYNMFKQEMAQQINTWLSVNPNKIPTSKDLQLMANNCVQSGEVKTATDQFNDIVSSVEFTAGDIRDYSAVKKALIDQIKSKSNVRWYEWYNKSEEKVIDRAADYLIDGDKVSAYNILKEANLFD